MNKDYSMIDRFLDNPKALRATSIVLILIIALSIYSLFRAGGNFVNSGTLDVSTPNDDSIITLSRENSVADVIGNGKYASARIAPGTYLLGVARQGRVSYETVDIIKGDTVKAQLSATSTPLLPSSANIDFQGTDALQDRGITPDQVTSIRQAIFVFKHDTSKAVIDTKSITSPPRNPDSAVFGFSKIFTLTIDDKPYRATISYSNLDSASLALTDQSGVTVFDSGDGGHD